LALLVYEARWLAGQRLWRHQPAGLDDNASPAEQRRFTMKKKGKKEAVKGPKKGGK